MHPKRKHKMSPSPLWTPSEARQRESNLSAFARDLGRAGPPPSSYSELHAYSVAEPEAFWSAVWDFGRVKAGLEINHEFWFTNTGNGPLEILKVQPS